MGTWGMRSFENDEALDWADELEGEGVDLIRASLTPEEIEGYYLEAPECVRVLCAAEVIAALKGRPSPNIPEEVLSWAHANQGAEIQALVPVAMEKLNRVLAEHSELRELWEENQENYSVWLSEVHGLRERVSS